jgi:hypothetical protein
MAEFDGYNMLLPLILEAKDVPQRVAACIHAFNNIEYSDSSGRLLAWFAEEAEKRWFREDINPEQEAPDVTGLLSLMENTNDSKKESNKSRRELLTTDDINHHLSKWKGLISGIIDFLSNCGYKKEEYYNKLWEALTYYLNDKSDIEKGISLFAVLLDKRTPYYAVRPGMRMSNDQYKVLTERIMPQLDKTIFVLNLSNSQKTETASQILDIIEEIKDREEKAVYISKLLSIYASQKE